MSRTSSNTLPNINTFALWIPHPTLCVHGPVEIELPDASGIADKTWHCGLCRWLDVVGGDEDVLGEGGEGARAGDVADERRAGVAGESRKGGGEVEYK